MGKTPVDPPLLRSTSGRPASATDGAALTPICRLTPPGAPQELAP